MELSSAQIVEIASVIRSDIKDFISAHGYEYETYLTNTSLTAHSGERNTQALRAKKGDSNDLIPTKRG